MSSEKTARHAIDTDALNLLLKRNPLSKYALVCTPGPTSTQVARKSGNETCILTPYRYAWLRDGANVAEPVHRVSIGVAFYDTVFIIGSDETAPTWPGSALAVDFVSRLAPHTMDNGADVSVMIVGGRVFSEETYDDDSIYTGSFVTTYVYTTQRDGTASLETYACNESSLNIVGVREKPTWPADLFTAEQPRLRMRDATIHQLSSTGMVGGFEFTLLCSSVRPGVLTRRGGVPFLPGVLAEDDVHSILTIQWTALYTDFSRRGGLPTSALFQGVNRANSSIQSQDIKESIRALRLVDADPYKLAAKLRSRTKTLCVAMIVELASDGRAEWFGAVFALLNAVDSGDYFPIRPAIQYEDMRDIAPSRTMSIQSITVFGLVYVCYFWSAHIESLDFGNGVKVVGIYQPGKEDEIQRRAMEYMGAMHETGLRLLVPHSTERVTDTNNMLMFKKRSREHCIVGLDGDLLTSESDDLYIPDITINRTGLEVTLYECWKRETARKTVHQWVVKIVSHHGDGATYVMRPKVCESLTVDFLTDFVYSEKPHRSLALLCCNDGYNQFLTSICHVHEYQDGGMGSDAESDADPLIVETVVFDNASGITRVRTIPTVSLVAGSVILSRGKNPIERDSTYNCTLLGMSKDKGSWRIFTWRYGRSDPSRMLDELAVDDRVSTTTIRAPKIVEKADVLHPIRQGDTCTYSRPIVCSSLIANNASCLIASIVTRLRYPADGEPYREIFACIESHSKGDKPVRGMDVISYPMHTGPRGGISIEARDLYGTIQRVGDLVVFVVCNHSRVVSVAVSGRDGVFMGNLATIQTARVLRAMLTNQYCLSEHLTSYQLSKMNRSMQLHLASGHYNIDENTIANMSLFEPSNARAFPYVRGVLYGHIHRCASME